MSAAVAHGRAGDKAKTNSPVRASSRICIVVAGSGHGCGVAVLGPQETDGNDPRTTNDHTHSSGGAARDDEAASASATVVRRAEMTSADETPMPILPIAVRAAGSASASAGGSSTVALGAACGTMLGTSELTATTAGATATGAGVAGGLPCGAAASPSTKPRRTPPARTPARRGNAARTDRDGRTGRVAGSSSNSGSFIRGSVGAVVCSFRRTRSSVGSRARQGAGLWLSERGRGQVVSHRL